MLGKALTTAAAGSAAGAAGALYVEDVFSTYLYTGNGGTQTITNDIDLAAEGGLVWIKTRSTDISHALFDTARGTNKVLSSNLNFNENYFGVPTDTLTAFNATGFSLGADATIYLWTNTSGRDYASWTFRKAEKFFDVVTYTGTGANRTVAHNLGSVPGVIIVKRTDTTGDWQVYHRSLANTEYMVLNSSAAKATGATRWNSTTPTSAVFSLGTDATVNASGGTYVAYLFAHDAGGFGDDGTESVIKCGSYTGLSTGGSPVVNLGWEPQFVITKAVGNGLEWFMFDNMRGVTNGGVDALLRPYSDIAETNDTQYIEFTSTGFRIDPTRQGYHNNPGGQDVIYIAIRRGPMKTPTDATEVFSPLTFGRTTTPQLVGFSPDMWIGMDRNGNSGALNGLRLLTNKRLNMSGTGTEDTNVDFGWDAKTDYWWQNNYNFGSPINWLFRRAPGFFDVVAYTGNGVAGRTVAHGLGVVPELVIVKRRDDLIGWPVYTEATGNTGAITLNNNAAFAASSAYWNNTSPTSSVFSVGSSGISNANGGLYIAYLFATLAGISKVGSYTGTGTTKNIDCGFSAGARFVWIKRTDSTGDWYVWDSARGIVSGNDPYLQSNAYFAEVTNTDYIDPLSSGFQITSSATAAINASGGSFIFLAIA